jgi:hypothetical protein
MTRPPHLPTEPRGREDLAGVKNRLRVEGAPHQLHGVEVLVVVHLRHVLGLVHAHAVLSGDGPAMLDAEVENRAADLLSRLGGALDRLVEEDEGM